MHRPLSLLKAVTCFTLASTVVARPGFDLTETEKELLERVRIFETLRCSD